MKTLLTSMNDEQDSVLQHPWLTTPIISNIYDPPYYKSSSSLSLSLTRQQPLRPTTRDPQITQHSLVRTAKSLGKAAHLLTHDTQQPTLQVGPLNNGRTPWYLQHPTLFSTLFRQLSYMGVGFVTYVALYKYARGIFKIHPMFEF